MAKSTVTPEEARRFELNRDFVLHMALLAILALWCFSITRPFIGLLVWSVILAVALYPGFKQLRARLGGRGGLAATLITLVGLAVIIVPSVLLSSSLFDTIEQVSQGVEKGTLHVPAPPEGVKNWPLVGESIWDLWSLAATDLGAALAQVKPQVKSIGKWLLETVTSTGAGILGFTLSIIIAGVLLAKGDEAGEFGRKVFTRVAGERGRHAAGLAAGTVRSVAVGVIGIAIAQSLLAGVGMLAAGVPAAGFLALIVLMLAILQLPPALVLLPAVIYAFGHSDAVTAVLFLIFMIPVSFLDMILKPVLFGRGLPVPMLIVVIGSIGGMITEGLIGLFVGAVVLALGYTLFIVWLDPEAHAASEAEADEGK